MLFSFQNEFYLVFLFFIPIFILFHFISLRHLRSSSLKFANFEAISRVKGVDIYSKKLSLLLINVVIIILIVLGMSGFSVTRVVDASEFAYVIIIDTSESMTAIDFHPSRLSVAKDFAKEFVRNLPYESYVGVMSFSGDSYIEKTVTSDKGSIINAIDSIQVSTTSGTDMYEAVSNSIKLLKDEDNRAIMLLSDGQINVGSVDEAINDAVVEEVVVHTVGVGTIEGGEAIYGISKLDENILKSLSYSTGGKYVKLSPDETFAGSYNEIIQLTRKEVDYNLRNYLFIAALLVFVLKELLGSISKIGW